MATLLLSQNVLKKTYSEELKGEAKNKWLRYGPGINLSEIDILSLKVVFLSLLAKFHVCFCCCVGYPNYKMCIILD